jgi:hypothetical protein
MKANDQRNIIEQLLGITLLSEKAESIKQLIKDSKDNIQQEEFKIKAIEEANKRVKEQIESLKRRQTLWKQKHEVDTNALMNQWLELHDVDITSELQAHKDLAVYNNKVKEKADLQKWLTSAELALGKESKQLEKLKLEVEKLKKHECYACGQTMHDTKHEEVLLGKEKALQESALQVLTTSGEIETLSGQIQDIGDVGQMPKCFYDTEQQAFEHANKMTNLEEIIRKKAEETDPYSEQIAEMENQALQTIDFDAINRITRTMEHQKFLLDLLTSKDSFVRKKIIDQNLSYLNGRLTNYLDKLGLPHQVVFLNDLSVEITELGRELDFDNLSRGERNRLILGLSFAFRDVWENLYVPINTLFIDELIDSGLDTMGVENSIAILKDMSRRRQKSIWLVSHREELAGRVPSVLKVIKENGFTSYNTSVDVE